MKLWIVNIPDYGVFILEAKSQKAAHHHIEEIFINANIPFDAIRELTDTVNYRLEYNNYVEITPFTNESRRNALLNSQSTLSMAIEAVDLQITKYGLACPHHLKTEIEELRFQQVYVTKQLEELAP